MHLRLWMPVIINAATNCAGHFHLPPFFYKLPNTSTHYPNYSMRKVLLLLLVLAATSRLYSQDFSNKGKEFWIGYGDHVGMHSGSGQQMSLYITSDVNTTGLVEIPGAVPAVSIPF